MGISREIYEYCELCPRKCHADRTGDGLGFCGMGAEAVLAKAMLHPWEEPGITGNGAPSGAVFFTGCTMQCVYCQNRVISESGSRSPIGVPRTPEQMAQIFLRLQKEGASNIDLVTPTHFLPDITAALDLCQGKLTIPVVYNTGGYERAEIIRAVSPYIDYWLPDVKYFDDSLSVRYSRAPRYFETACEALAEMIAAAEKKFAEKAAERKHAKKDPADPADSTSARLRPAKEHIIVRHMVLPGQKEDSIRILKELAARFGTEKFLVSLMSQYTPQEGISAGTAADTGTSSAPAGGNFPELSRRVTSYEYEKVVEEALGLGFDGYRQDRTTAKKEYTPEFDLSGL